MARPLQGWLHRALRWLVGCLFRVEVRGLEHYPADDRRLLIVANHTSFLDGLLLSVFLPEVPLFVVNTRMAARWWVRPFVEYTRHITIDPTNPHYLKALIQQLRGGQRVAIFPEGRLSVTGSLMKVYEGPAVAADHADAEVLPVHIAGAEYSLLSRLGGRLRRRPFPRIRLTVLAPRKLRAADGLSGRARRMALGDDLDRLMTELAFRGAEDDRAVMQALIDASRLHGAGREILVDTRYQPLSYRGLLRRALALAELMGPAPAGERVAVMLPNAVAAVVVLVALWMRGRVPVVLNFTLGPQALAGACRTAGVRTVYTARAFVEAARLEEGLAAVRQAAEVVMLEDLAPRATAAVKLRALARSLLPLHSHRAWAGRVDADTPAVVLFTSGSEGAPKGVALSHRNLLSNIAQVRATLDFGPSDRLLNALPMFHSFGLTAATLAPLLCGVRSFLYPSPLHYHAIPELAYEQRATLLFGTNTFLAGYGRAANAYDFFSLRLVVAGAEPLRPETSRVWAERFGLRIIQGYGVTEASPVLAANSPRHHRAGSVGRLLPGIEYYLEPVPGIAEGGRLYVRGPNVMLGYLDPADPWRIVPPASERGPGWHDTGDIVALDDDGYLHILGRAKRFAKIGGEMVSLAAVEALAARCWPEAAHAAVSLPDAVKGERVVLVTTEAGAERAALQALARRDGVGELLVPRTLRVVAHLPLLGTGKVDGAAVQRLAEAD